MARLGRTVSLGNRRQFNRRAAQLVYIFAPKTTGAHSGDLSDPSSTPNTGVTTLKLDARYASGSGILRAKILEGGVELASADFTLTNSFQRFSLDVPGISNYNNLEFYYEGRNENGGALTPEVRDLWLVAPGAALAPSADIYIVYVGGGYYG